MSILESSFRSALVAPKSYGYDDDEARAITSEEFLNRLEGVTRNYTSSALSLSELQKLAGMAVFETDDRLSLAACNLLERQVFHDEKNIFQTAIVPELMNLAGTHPDQRVRFFALNTVQKIQSGIEVTINKDDNQGATRTLMTQLLDGAEGEDNKPRVRENFLTVLHSVIRNNPEIVNESDVSRLSVMGYTASGGERIRQSARSVLETLQTCCPDLTQQRRASPELKENIQSTFQTLQESLPDILKHAAPIAMGSSGIVVDTGDGAATKIFLRGNTEQEQQERLALYQSEIDIMERMSKLRLDGVDFPHLKGTLEYRLNYGDPRMEYTRSSTYDLNTQPKMAVAGYVMTKLSGREIHWDDFLANAEPDDVESHFRNVGSVLAQFHAKAPAVLGDLIPPVKSLEYGTSVAQVTSADDRTNQALAICNDYLQANMQPGVSHGDFHPFNFKVNDNNEISGLFDFSFSGMSQNQLYDFANIPDAGLPHVMKEYEQRTGKTIDPVLLAITKISQDVAIINWHTDKPGGTSEFANQARQRLTKNLNSVQHVTGLSFDVDQTKGLAGEERTGDLLLNDFNSARSADNVTVSPQVSQPKADSKNIKNTLAR